MLCCLCSYIASICECSVLPSIGNVGHIFLQLCPSGVSAWSALPHLWMPPNTELALCLGTHTHTHFDRNGARQTSDMLPYSTTVWDVHCHYMPKPLSSTTPHRLSLRPGQPCPAVCDPVQTWLTQVHAPSTPSTIFLSTNPTP